MKVIKLLAWLGKLPWIYYHLAEFTSSPECQYQ